MVMIFCFRQSKAKTDRSPIVVDHNNEAPQLPNVQKKVASLKRHHVVQESSVSCTYLTSWVPLKLTIVDKELSDLELASSSPLRKIQKMLTTSGCEPPPKKPVPKTIPLAPLSKLKTKPTNAEVVSVQDTIIPN
jgi:hypothetical protein